MRKRRTNEARWRISPTSGKANRVDIDDIDDFDDFDDFDEIDSEEMPEEVVDFMEEDYEDFSEENDTSNTYTLEDIVSTKVLNTKSAAGAKAFVSNILDMMKQYIGNDEFFAVLSNLKNSERIYRDFEEIRDIAVNVWIEAASTVLDKDVSKLPEFRDRVFMDVFLFDFWFMAEFVKPFIRQLKRGKTEDEAMQHIKKAWHYRTLENRVKDFIKRTMTPAFEYLTRDTSIAG